MKGKRLLVLCLSFTWMVISFCFYDYSISKFQKHIGAMTIWDGKSSGWLVSSWAYFRHQGCILSLATEKFRSKFSYFALGLSLPAHRGLYPFFFFNLAPGFITKNKQTKTLQFHLCVDSWYSRSLFYSPLITLESRFTKFPSTQLKLL